MRRFSILGLMGLVLALAVAMAALRGANDAWAGGLVLGIALLIGLAGLGSIYAEGPRRARRMGFAAFAGGYFALALLGLSEANLARLPTSQVLLWIHQRVAVTGPATFTVVLNNSVTRLTQVNAPSPALVMDTIDLAMTPAPGPVQPVNFSFQAMAVDDTTNPNPWQSVFPGAANYAAFNVVGHCLFALLAGVSGSLIAGRMRARQLRVATPAAD
ncbi:MAG: hypothetical protein U0800_13940 [Isosphaeraceae bacterium]